MKVKAGIRWSITAAFALLGSAAQAATDLPDPTRPSDYYVPQSVTEVPRRDAAFSLSANRISPQDRSALLNGTIVRVGDVLDSAKVVEINPTEVIVEYDRKRLTVPLYAQGVTKTLVKEPVK